MGMCSPTGWITYLKCNEALLDCSHRSVPPSLLFSQLFCIEPFFHYPMLPFPSTSTHLYSHYNSFFSSTVSMLEKQASMFSRRGQQMLHCCHGEEWPGNSRSQIHFDSEVDKQQEQEEEEEDFLEVKVEREIWMRDNEEKHENKKHEYRMWYEMRKRKMSREKISGQFQAYQCCCHW